ncbi:BTAD domain-containing putative transcriptional regulator, partial [Conexibacter sp. CPCC 205706]
MRVTLCGAFALEPRDSGAPLPGGQARQVLTYLAARSGRLIRREVLHEVLWPRAGSAPQDPDAVLSSLLSRMRPLIAPARIESSGGGVGLLLPERSSVDVEVAAAALEQARDALAAGDGRAAGAAAARALAIAEAGFLPEQEEDWTAGPRELVQTLRLDALECEANAAVLLGGAPLAAGEQAARIAVVLAPLRESAHAALMRVLAARGNTAEALRVYEQLRRLLMEELGVAPSPELRALHERLLGGDEGVTPQALLAEVLASGNGNGAPQAAAATGGAGVVALAPPTAAAGKEAWERPPLPPVVRALGSGEPAGRETALRLLQRSVERVRADGPRAALILGEPGMGTSRLACVFARQCYDDGAYVLFGRAEPGTGGGATALREAFAPLAGAAGWDDERWREAAAEEGEGPWARALRDACERVVAVAREQFVVVVIDDAESLDAASARLLRLVLESPDTRLLLVLTATTRALRGGSATWHVLDRLRQVARRDDVVLDDLDAAAVAALVADELPAAPAQLGAALYDYVGGHPVLVREAIEELRGHADPLVALRTAVPQTLRASVAQRLARLSEPARRVARGVAALDGAALIGTLAQVLALDRELVLDAVAEAAEERLLRLERDQRHVGFQTRLERDVTIALIGRAELARDAAAAVATLTAAGVETPVLGRLALRAIPALSADDACERAYTGLRELLERRDFGPAETLADAALDARPSPPLRARLLVAAGEAR